MRATGLVLSIARFAVHDGPGIRTTVFLKGCPLRCQWCHSPETQRPHPELTFKADRCIACGICMRVCAHRAIALGPGASVTLRDRCLADGACAAACPTGARTLAGRRMDVPDLIREVERDRVFFDRSGGGVTFSGGEPLMQPAFLRDALAACRHSGLHTAIETSGCASSSAITTALAADALFFDLKAMDDTVHRRVTGVSNRRILENFRRVAHEHRSVRPRVPLVPGVNDDDRNLDSVGDLVASVGLRAIDLLPYHTAGLAKYTRLDRPYALPHAAPPSGETLARARSRLEAFGLLVHIGG